MAQLVKTVMGLAIAAVKTWNGLAIASAKTINGVDNTGGGGGASFTDDFNRGNEFPMTTPWESGMGGFGEMYILSSTLLASGATSLCGVLASSTAFANNQGATIEIGTNKYEIGPAVRIQSNGDCYYMRGVTNGTDDMIRVFKATGGGVTLTQMGADIVVGTTPTFTSSDTFTLEATGTSTTTLTVIRNGSTLDTRSDSTSPHNDGQPGVFLDGTSGADNFFAEDL